MPIVFHPDLSGINFVLVESSPALLNFTATLSVTEYNELKRDGGTIQLWSDIPVERAPSPCGEWASCDFNPNMITHQKSVNKTSLGDGGDDTTSSPQTSVLTLQALVPFSNKEQTRFSFTYRILYSSGEIRWLGDFGQNGTFVFERTTAETSVGLAAGWVHKEGLYAWTGSDETNQTDTTSDDTITVSGAGSLLLNTLTWDLRVIKDMLLEHCSPERVMITEIGEDIVHLLIATRNSLLVEGIVICPSAKAFRNTPLSVPTETLRALLPIDSSLSPFSLFVPLTGKIHLISGAPITFLSAFGPFVLSSAFNINAGVYISILSPHTSAHLVEILSGILPTPPPSPELASRLLVMPANSSESALFDAPEVDGGDEGLGQAGDKSNFDGKIAGPPSSRLPLRALVPYARHVLSVALFVITLIFQLFFSKYTTASPENLGEIGDDESPEHVNTENAPKILEQVDVDDVALNQDVNVGDCPHSDHDGDENRASGGGSLNLENDMVPASVGPHASGNLGLVLDINPKTLWVEVGAGAVKLAMWVGEARGDVVAEMNGQTISVNRTKGPAQTDVEFWEFEAVMRGMVRISCDLNREKIQTSNSV
ncbi:hypothetical protein C0991_008771 [Blastosporella zonata]|nr:hypothetical protein C0991_008771 [Blastosporella zonata]